jgi:uncharacterized protein YlaN (UPF0358 family)
MEEQKQYHDELLEWCNHIFSYCNSMKPRVSNHLDMERLEEWEGSCLQLKEKLQTDLNADYDDYLTAKSLYEEWEQLFRESNAFQEEIKVDFDNRLELEEQSRFHEELLETNAYQEEIEIDSDNRLELEEQSRFHEESLKTNAYQEETEVDSDNRLELEEQTQIHEESLETNTVQAEIEVETDKCIDLDEQLQYREELLERCNNIYSNWERRKPSFSEIFENLVEWEVSYRLLKEKLQADIKADFNDYQQLKTYMNNGNSYSKNRLPIKKL